jgi:rhamnose transport system permease protein
VLLGGVSIFGGKGTLVGVLAGVVLLAALQNALRLQDVSGQALNIVTGALLVLSVLLPNLATSIRATWQRRRLRRAATV